MERWEIMRKITVLLLSVLIFALWAVPAYGTEDTDPYSTGVFEPCEYIPSFATVPDFYVPIENVTCMYMFIDSEGIPHKRWYGSVDGVYGWYAVEDGEMRVRDYSMPINVEDDRAMLKVKTDNKYSSEDDLGYVGLLPPEESKTEISELFGVPIDDFIFYGGICVAVLCMVIMAVAIVVKSRRKRWHF